MSAQPSDCGGCPFAVVASTASRSSELPGATAAASKSTHPWSNLRRGAATNYNLNPHSVVRGVSGKAGKSPTDDVTKKFTEKQIASQNGKDSREVGLRSVSGMASNSLTPRRSKHQDNIKAKKLIRCDSFSMNDHEEAGFHRQSTLIEVPSRHFSCKEPKSSVSTATLIGLENGSQFPDKLQVSVATKISSETSTSSSVEAETLLASKRQEMGTGLCLEKQLISEKGSSFFPHYEQDSCSIRNIGESKTLSSALQALSPLPHSHTIIRPISASSVSYASSLSSTSQQYSHHPASSITSFIPHLSCLSSSKSIALSPIESCATSLSWSTALHPIPSSFSFSKTQQPISPESALLDRVLLACGVICPNIRRNIIRVACDGHASLACRLTLAVLLDQAETCAVVTSANKESEKISSANVCSASKGEKFTTGVESVKIPLGGGLATCCNTDRTGIDVPSSDSSQKKNDCEKTIRRSSDFAKRKYVPSDSEKVPLDPKKKLNWGLVTNSFLCDQTNEFGRIHNTNDLKNTFSCYATKTCSSISNCSPNLQHPSMSAVSIESKLKKNSAHRSFSKRVSPPRKVSDCVENICASDFRGSDHLSVPPIKTSSFLGSRKSIFQTGHSNSSCSDELGENNSCFLSGSPTQISSHSCSENDVSQQSAFTHDEDISVIWMNLNKSSSRSCFPSLGSLKSWPENGERQGTTLVDSTGEHSGRSISPDMFASSQSYSAHFGSVACESNVRSQSVPLEENAVRIKDERVTYEEKVQNLKMSNSTDGRGVEDQESKASDVVASASTSTAIRNSVNKQKVFLHYKPDISSINVSFTTQSINSKNKSKVNQIVLNTGNLSTAKTNEVDKFLKRKPLVNIQSRDSKEMDYSGGMKTFSKDKIRKLLCRTQSFFEPAQKINVAFGLEKQRNSFDSKPTSKKSKRSSRCDDKITAQHASENNLPYPDGSTSRKLPRLETQACIGFGSELNDSSIPPVSRNPGGIWYASLPSVVEKKTNASSSFLDIEKNSIPFEILDRKNKSISSTRENMNLTPKMFSTRNRCSDGIPPLLSGRKTEIIIDDCKQLSLLDRQQKQLVSNKLENFSFSETGSSSKPVLYSDSPPKPTTDNKSSAQSISSSKFMNQNSSYESKQESCENSNISSTPASAGHSETTDKLDSCALNIDVLKNAADVPLVAGFTGRWVRRALNPVDVGLNFTAPHHYYQLLSVSMVSSHHK